MLLSGFLFGLTLQLSVGPVCLAVLQRAVSKGFKEAAKMVLGVTVADGLYIMASQLGMAKILTIVIFKKVVLLAGAMVLAYFGFVSCRQAFQTKENNRQFALAQNSFSYGLKLTLANPLTIVFWAGTFGSLIASGQITRSSDLFVFSGGCLAATLVFLGFIALGGDRLSVYLYNKRIKGAFDFLVGSFLLIVALLMVFK